MKFYVFYNGYIGVVGVKLIETENFFAELKVLEERIHAFFNGFYQVIIYREGYIVRKERGLPARGEVSYSPIGAVFLV